MNKQNQKAVVVLGMHRSGTSALTAGLEALGISLGNKTELMNDENPKGFFENRDITPFNDQLLKFLQARWDNPLFDCRKAASRIKEQLLSPWYEEAGRLFKENFSGKIFFGLKDPRFCLLLPFWQEVFTEFGLTPDNLFFLHIVRNPLEVALSQQKRQKDNPDFFFIGEAPRQTLALWFAHYFRVFSEIRSNNNLFLTYEGLLRAPTNQLHRIADFLGIDSSKKSIQKQIDIYASSFLDKNLRRSKWQVEDSGLLTSELRLVSDMYDFMQTLAQKGVFPAKELRAFLKHRSCMTNTMDVLSSVSDLYSTAWYHWHDARNKLRERSSFFNDEKERFITETRALTEQKESAEAALRERTRLHEEQGHQLENLSLQHSDLIRQHGEICRLHEILGRQHEEICRLHENLSLQHEDLSRQHRNLSEKYETIVQSDMFRCGNFIRKAVLLIPGGKFILKTLRSWVNMSRWLKGKLFSKTRT